MDKNRDIHQALKIILRFVNNEDDPFLLQELEKDNLIAILTIAILSQRKKKYNKMKQYYLLAIEKDCDYAMVNLGLYYSTVERNYEKMKEYLHMAVEMQNIYAIKHMINYYQNTEKNDEMRMYFEDLLELES